ncbi:MAG TPA: SMR family transporter [Steroidobacter sp.]
MNLRMLALAIVSVALSALAQMAFKWGMSQAAVQHAVAASSSARWMQTLLPIVTSPAIIAGFALYAGSALLWLFVLARLDLSVAYPFVGLGFILTMLAGALLFHEPVTTTRIAGTLLVCVGVWLVARS